MSPTDPRHSNDPQHPAESTPPAVDIGARQQQHDPDAVYPETAYGGADAVEKTSYVVGRGTEPEAQADGASIAHPKGGGSPNYLAWGIGALAIIVALIYLLGLLA